MAVYYKVQSVDSLTDKFDYMEEFESMIKCQYTSERRDRLLKLTDL
jgi:hypothetical protein